jgi:hypothetical protein
MGERGGKSWTFQKSSQRLSPKKAEIYQKMSDFFNKMPEIFSRLSEKLG